MLKIIRTRIDDNSWYNYYLKDENNQLGIVFMGNGDLYFTSKMLDENMKGEFNITKENIIIYNLLDELFNSFKKTKIFEVDDFQLELCESDEDKNNLYKQYEEWNDSLKEKYFYRYLFNNDTITWICDDCESFDINNANSLQIIKEENSYKLKFNFNDKQLHTRSIRIRNSGSRYTPFNIIMMNFFRELQNYNPEYHQVHMEEYMYKKLIKK